MHKNVHSTRATRYAIIDGQQQVNMSNKEHSTDANSRNWYTPYKEEASTCLKGERKEARFGASSVAGSHDGVRILGDSAQQQATSSKKAPTNSYPSYRKGLEEEDDEASMLPPVTPPTCSRAVNVHEKQDGCHPTEFAQPRTNQYEEPELKDVLNKTSDDVLDYDEENAVARSKDFADENTQVTDSDDGNEDCPPCQEFWKEEFQEWSGTSATDDHITAAGSKVDSKTVIAEPIEQDDMETEVRRQVRSEISSELLARMSVATPLSPNKSKGNFCTRKRLITIATLALLAIVGIVVGVVVGTREPPPDPNTLRGLFDGGRFGDTVVISQDGTTLAVGAVKGNYVQVFRGGTKNGQPWKQIGQTLYGDGEGDQFGQVIDLNHNGSMLAVGAWNNDDSGPDAGHAKVYRYGDGLWEPVGKALVGDASEDRFGWQVTLSGNAETLAVSARQGDPNNIVKAGYVRVFSLHIGDEWLRLGSDLEGEVAVEEFGKSLAMSADGRRLAVGTTQWNEFRGRVSIFDFSAENATWTQLGVPLEGRYIEDYLGAALALSADGSILAVGSDGDDSNGNNTGRVIVYELGSGTYKQRGQDLLGEIDHARFGIRKLSLSRDGNCLAAGANHHDSDRGKGYLYRWNRSKWDQIAALVGDRPGDRFGGSSAVSGDCSVAAWGAPEYDSEGLPPGYVKIYYV